MTTKVDSTEHAPTSARIKVVLRNLQDSERTIAYATAGDPSGTPVLFFYPAGGNRRMISTFHDIGVSASLNLICVNRPGTGGTSPAGRGASEQVATACNDAAAVLDFLRLPRVGLLCMCAGAPFAMAFACRFPDRVTGKFVGIAPYVSPADCPDAKVLHRFGALHCSFCFIGPIVANVIGSIGYMLTSLPQSMILSGMRRKLSTDERKAFDEKFSQQDWAGDMTWMLEEKGDKVNDIFAILSKGGEVGIDYERIGGEVTLLHGDKDKTVPFAASVWLEQQIPTAKLICLQGGSHEGALFLLHAPVIQAINSFNSRK